MPSLANRQRLYFSVEEGFTRFHIGHSDLRAGPCRMKNPACVRYRAETCRKRGSADGVPLADRKITARRLRRLALVWVTVEPFANRTKARSQGVRLVCYSFLGW